MPADMLWKSDLEKAAFNRLEMLLPSLKLTGLTDTHRALSLLLGKRRTRGVWDWGVLEDFVNSYELELSQQEKTLESGLQIVKTSLDKTYDVKRRKGKLIDLLEEEWTKDDSSHLEKTLGTLAKCFPGLKDPRTAIFLMALAFIIVYETKGAFARRRLQSWLMPSIKEKKKRERIVEDFLTLDTPGTDGRSDFAHLRNGFAHGHFELKDDTTVIIWDLSDEGEETYRRQLSIQDLKRLVEISQKKLEMLEAYPYVQIAIQSLFETYQQEWKKFKR